MILIRTINGCRAMLKNYRKYALIKLSNIHRSASVLNTSTHQRPYEVANETSADEVARLLEEKLGFRNNRTLILLDSAGKGLIAESLVKCGASKVILFDPFLKNKKYLREAAEKLNGKVIYRKYSLLNYTSLCKFVNKESAEDKEESSSSHTIVLLNSLASGAPSLMKTLTNRLTHEINIYGLDQANVYVIFTRNEVEVLKKPDKYWNEMGRRCLLRSVYYKLFFHGEVVTKIPVGLFNPLVAKHLKRDASLEPSNLYLVQLTPTPDIFNDIPNPRKFITLLNQVFPRSASRLIPFMENLSPGCGLTLLQMGFSMHDTLKSVSIEDWVKIYKSYASDTKDEETYLDTLTDTVTAGVDEDFVADDSVVDSSIHSEGDVHDDLCT